MTSAEQKSGVGVALLWILAILGLVLIGYRFVNGLGAVTNLSDGYPWGLWIGVDILAGIALAAGGFVIAGIVHIFGGERFHALAKPAITTAFLGYLLFIFGLTVDLGRPWNLWRAIFHWNHLSPMFEVAWCVMLYTFVLFLEFLPSFFERFKMEGLMSFWRAVVPWLIVALLGLFTLAMTDSTGWTIAVVVILVFWEIMMRTGAAQRKHQMPVLLIMAGVMFSTMHQSSLGTLFTMAPHKLHVLWYSSYLPLMFFISAVMVAPAMVVVESLFSEGPLNHKPHMDLLAKLGAAMPWLLAIYAIIKVVDLALRGSFGAVFSSGWQSFAWWLEMLVGVVIPFLMFLSAGARAKKGSLLTASLLVVIGLIVNRINVSVVGISSEGWPTYYPYWAEIFITLGIMSIGILVYRLAVKTLPIYEDQAPSLT